jgi:hypothetical protein
MPKINKYQKYDIKFGIFIYNPNQEMNKNNNNPVTNPFDKYLPSPQEHLVIHN